MWLLFALLLAPQQPAQAQLPRDTSNAYADAAARELVHRAREHRATVDRSILSYRTLAKENISAGLQALHRDRMLYRRQMAARITWRRDAPGKVEVVGAREAIPVAFRDVRLPEDLRSDAPDLAFDPAGDRLMFGGSDSSFVRHPLAEGSEANYRFASGDTTTIRLPDGRALRLVELRVTPRREDVHLVRGSLWLDAGTASVVRAVFRLAQAFDLERDADPDDRDDVKDIPGVLRPIRADMDYVTIEYGLVDFHWWLPRLIAMDGWVQIGSLARMPIRYERSYSRYDVVGDTAALPAPRTAVAEADRPEQCRSRPASVQGEGGDAARDSARAARRRAREAAAKDTSAIHCQCDEGRCFLYALSVPTDTAALLHSAALPPSIYSEGETLASESELRDLAATLKLVPPRPWQLGVPSVHWGLGGSGLARYNRVEGLSLGARTELDLGRAKLDGTVRLGLANGAADTLGGAVTGARVTPSLEIGASRDGFSGSYRVAAYHRVAGVDPDTRPLGFGNSATAFFLGRDDGDYFRATGVELLRHAPPGHFDRLGVRLFAERQRNLPKATDWSLAHLWGSDDAFRPNVVADAANEVGTEVKLRFERGLDPEGVRWGLVLGAEAAAGSYDYVRPQASARLGFPLPGPFVGSVAGAAGSSAGTLPAQREFFLGGPATLRGFGGGAAQGPAFWRGRAEIGTAFSGARLAAFSDAGWAGPRADFRRGSPLISVGAGTSLLDGLIRLDLARAVRGGTGWRLDLYLDALM